MNVRLFAAAIVVCVAPVAVRAADDENPYKNAKVGDFGSYKLTIVYAGQNVAGTLTQSVKSKNDKELTIETTGRTMGKDIPAREQKIDLTKPFDPTKLSNQPGAADTKVEKGKEGKETVKVAGKSYETTWTTYSLNGKSNGREIASDIKVWMSKDIPTAIAKMELTMTVNGTKVEMTMELTETGNKK